MSDIVDQHENNERDNGRSDPIELDSKTILIQNKRFYLDVKENDRGRFLKIAEVTPGGHKNRVTMAMQLLPEFRDNLSDFVEHYISLGPANLSDNNDDYDNRRPLKTARIVSGPRRYFLDLKENVRGRYLRVRAPGQHQDMPQQVIVIPALGIVEFRNTLSKVIEEFGVESYKGNNNQINNRNHDDELDENELPNSAVIGSRRTKVFYMDIGKNNRGVFCRMTEQSANFRQSLTVPDRYFREIGEWFLKAADHLENGPHSNYNHNSNSRGAGDNQYLGNNNNSNNNNNNDNRDNGDNNDNFQRKQEHRRARGVNDGLSNRRDKDDDEYSE